MKTEPQKKMLALAEEVGMKVEFVEGMPKSFCGCQHLDAPVVLIDLNQPQYEQIYTFLHEHGHFVLHYQHGHPIRLPSFLNRSYENELLGEAVYKIKRVIRLKLNKEWQADLWAMCLYCQIGCPDDLSVFLKHHPEKLPFFLTAVAAHVKTRISKSTHTLFRL